MNRVGELVRKLEPHGGPIVAAIRSFFTQAIGRKQADEEELHKVWLASQAELGLPACGRPSTRLRRLPTRSKRPARRNGRSVCAPNKLLPITIPPRLRHGAKPVTGAAALIFLEHIDGHDKMRELFAQRKTLTTALARTYQDPGC